MAPSCQHNMKPQGKKSSGTRRSATGHNGQAAKEKRSAIWRGPGCRKNISGVPREKCFSLDIPSYRTVITDEQREEFGHLIQESIRRIEAAEFLPHSGIRFPQNPCTSCAYIGLCLGRPDLAEAALERRPGAEDFGLFDDLTY